MRRIFATLMTVGCLSAYAHPMNVLVFSRTTGFRHDSIPIGITCLKTMAEKNDWRITCTEDPAVFSDGELAKYDVTVWLMTTGDVLDAVLAGRKPSVATTKVFGCSVKWAWKDDYTNELYREWAALPVTIEPIDVAGLKALLTNPSGKLRLINVWATWCGPCTAEFPELVMTDRMYRERDFEFISISADKMEKLGKALEFLKKNQASNRNYIFSGETVYPLIEAIDPGWQGALPYTVIVEPGGEMVLRHQGILDPLDLRKFIVEHPLVGRYY